MQQSPYKDCNGEQIREGDTLSLGGDRALAFRNPSSMAWRLRVTDAIGNPVTCGLALAAANGWAVHRAHGESPYNDMNGVPLCDNDAVISNGQRGVVLQNPATRVWQIRHVDDNGAISYPRLQDACGYFEKVEHTTPGHYCRQRGTTLMTVARATGQGRCTLSNWYGNPKKHKLFEIVVEWTAQNVRA